MPRSPQAAPWYSANLVIDWFHGLVQPERNLSVQVHGSGAQKSAINTKSLLLFGAGIFICGLFPRLRCMGVCWHSPAKGFFLSPVGRAPGFSLCTMLHSGIIRFYFIRLFPCIKQQPSPYMGRGLSYFMGLLSASSGKPHRYAVRHHSKQYKSVFASYRATVQERSNRSPSSRVFDPACNRSGPQAGNLLKRLKPCRRLGLGKITAVCGTR